MLSGTDEPECPQRQRTISRGIVGPVGSTAATIAPQLAILTSADDVPDRQATKALAHPTIHPAVNGAAGAGRDLFLTATQTDAGAFGATERANSSALN
jgi:hypothetical protein